MSYSFEITAHDKDEAYVKASEKFDEVVAAWRVHGQDRRAAMHALDMFLNLLAPLPEGATAKDIHVCMHGSVSFDTYPEGDHPVPLTHASVGISCYYIPRKG